MTKDNWYQISLATAIDQRAPNETFDNVANNDNQDVGLCHWIFPNPAGCNNDGEATPLPRTFLR
jgi:hypothetical protein